MAIGRLEWSRALLGALTTPLTDEQMLARAGGVGNHALWVMGHMAVLDDMLLRELAGRPVLLDERFAALFGGGSVPCADPGAYPSRATVRVAMTEARESMLAWLRTLSPDELQRPLPDWLSPIAPDIATLPFAECAHELFHAGQVATVRASLGLKPVFA